MPGSTTIKIAIAKEKRNEKTKLRREGNEKRNLQKIVHTVREERAFLIKAISIWFGFLFIFIRTMYYSQLFAANFITSTHN